MALKGSNPLLSQTMGLFPYNSQQAYFFQRKDLEY